MSVSRTGPFSARPGRGQRRRRFQGIQRTVADGHAQLYAGSLMRDRAASLVAEGKEHAFETSLAKKVAIDAAEKVINDVFALVGGHGLYHEQPFGQTSPSKSCAAPA